jgi:hypothetical protein
MKVAIVGGGPAGMFVFKRLVELNPPGLELTIFERHDRLGPGMPYGPVGACPEHLTNVSSNEIPELRDSLKEWLKRLPADRLRQFGIDQVHDYHVVPRLLFGEYLADEFAGFIELARQRCIPVTIHLGAQVRDIIPAEHDGYQIEGEQFDAAFVCTGHVWPAEQEEELENYFESPYPPEKLAQIWNHPVALRGSSLTAIDAIKTLARANGEFKPRGDQLVFERHEDAADFRLDVYSRDGFLPAVLVVFVADVKPHRRAALVCEFDELRAANDGFVPLDEVFRLQFKEKFRGEDPGFFEEIQHDDLETFIERMRLSREECDPFTYLEAEFEEASESIRQRECIPWKERLYLLSIALNGPARYLSGEDYLRLRHHLMPLIAVIIAAVPQGPARELLALHRAGCLDVHQVSLDSRVEPRKPRGARYWNDGESTDYEAYVDCVGQQPLRFEDFPFPALREAGMVSPARVKFRDAQAAPEDDPAVVREGEEALLTLPGIAIDPDFAAVGQNGEVMPGLYVLAQPLVAGYQPSFSGLGLCHLAAKKAVTNIMQQ